MAETPRQPTRPATWSERRRRWMTRIGVWGFVFFLVKGLAWLIVPALLAAGLSD